ncbi:hypothetical protein HJC23_011690 [Cyclotella cryptica]|uniref:Anaphase-promoting complex subunit 4 WD40 domain-containing protein n=1 Tax=Cyclotella cryptica TaxID=29204 RepID=A0ABD3QIZ8_9STRA|eukprot:CCRYP_004794-RA/>CCRYP_004794-RA protein AED:0.04 eAED:0.04 QI:195/1/1/1/0.5/0.33/3/190/1127
METPRRRSTRIKNQTSDDESSVASSIPSRSSTRASARARPAASPAKNVPDADADADASNIGTPSRARRTRSNSSTSADLVETPTSERRRSARSRATSDASDSQADVAVDSQAATETPTKARRAKSSSGDVRKSAKKGAAKSPGKLDVIPEVLEANDAEETAVQVQVPTVQPIGHDLSAEHADSCEAAVDDVAAPTANAVPRTPSPIQHDTSSKETEPEPTARTTDEKTSNKKKKRTRSKYRKNADGTPLIQPEPSETPVPVSPHQPPTNQKPIFHADVHCLRFLKLFPKSIVAMASSPSFLHRHRHPQVPQQPPQSESELEHKHQKRPIKQRQLLAISRRGGSVELVHPQERWITVGRVPGVREREVDALTWICGSHEEDGGGTTRGDVTVDRAAPPAADSASSPLLIGASRDGTLFLLDFITQRQTHVVGSGAGGVFCLASLCARGTCCRGSGSCGRYFAAGCEDGTIKLYCFNKGLELVATLPSAGNAVLSLAWLGNNNVAGDGSDGLGGSVIFAGVADGTIRRFDCVASVVATSMSTGVVLSTSDVLGSRTSSSSVVYRWKSTLRMTVENRGLRDATKVWALQALSDGTVISGDSLGHVQFWDGLFGTMLQTFSQSESGADVLCLAVSEDENKVFASGVDSRVMCIQRQALSGDDVTSVNPDSAPIRKWINVCAHRKHTHDVTALAICRKTAIGSRKQMELLVSGSVDTRVCTYVTDDFRSSRPRIWFNWSSISPVSMSRECRLIAVTRSDRIDLYRLFTTGTMDKAKACEEADESKCHVKTISIKSPFNLTCSTISNDGKFLAASDATTLYVFSLNVEEQDGAVDVHPTKLHLPKGCGRPSTALRFDGTGRLICATIDGSINILQLTPASSEDVGVAYTVSQEHVFEEHVSVVSSWPHNSPIVTLDVSNDGKWLAAVRFSRGKGSVHVFSLEPFGHWWSLPEMEATSTCIKFLGGGTLAVGCSNNAFHTFNLQRRSLSDWSHDMGLPVWKSLPKELTSRTEPLSCILSMPSSDQKLILGAHGFFCVVDMDQPVPDKSNTYPPDSLRAKRSVLYDDDAEVCPPPPKRHKSRPNDAIKNFTICLRYSNLLFQDFVNEKEMVVVEEPWMSILEELPDALARRVFGT